MTSLALTTVPSESSMLSTDQLVILDFILAHADGDERPYLTVKVLGVSIDGLLDSGASKSIVGGPGWQLLSKLGLELNAEHKVTCTIADGNTYKSIGSVNVPFSLEGKVIALKILVIPVLPHVLILGSDFWKRMGIVPDLRHGSWKFSTESQATKISADSISLRSETELSPDQSKILHDLVSTTFEAMGDKLGCTSLVEHEIVTSSKPIKQRYYPVSPIMQGHINEELDKLLAENIVEPSSSPWSSPILLVKKPDGTWRFV